MTLILIKDTLTGVTVKYYDNHPWHDFQWTQGNYGCDCNRAIFFGCEEDVECSIKDPGRFHIAAYEDHTCVYSELEGHTRGATL